ncbi:MAG: hypothetical protein J5857_00220 [Treponema sp.]|nr:hypothetical protein [Treponema sp.]
MTDKKEVCGMIEEFAKNNIEDIPKFGVGRSFSVEVYEAETGKKLGSYKACCTKQNSFALELENEDKDADSTIKGFHIEECMIDKERSTDTELVFRDTGKVSLFIVRHC